MIKKHYTTIDYNMLSAPRQMVLPLDYGVMITDDEPVRLLDAILGAKL